jgi:hypothetical protein
VTPRPLNTNELAAALGMSRWTLHRLKRDEPAFVKRFLVTPAIGQRKYSAMLVARYLAGESTVKYGRGSRAIRKAS